MGIAPRDAARLLAAGRVDEALAENPRMSRAWITKGLDAELADDFPGAESSLLHAAEWDRGWRPTWTLANYYYRRNSRAPFREWVRRAVAIPYSDPLPVFELAWRADLDATEFLIPDLRRKYLAFLIRDRHAPAAVPLAAAISRENSPADRELLLDSCDLFIGQAVSLPTATEIWRQLARDAPDSSGRCFGWRPSSDPEVTIRVDRGLRVEWSGNQPESLDLVWRYTTGAGPHKAECVDEGASGISWVMEPVSPGLSRLVLRYRRVPGTVRSPGGLRCTSVTP